MRHESMPINAQEVLRKHHVPSGEVFVKREDTHVVVVVQQGEPKAAQAIWGYAEQGAEQSADEAVINAIGSTFDPEVASLTEILGHAVDAKTGDTEVRALTPRNEVLTSTSETFPKAVYELFTAASLSE